LPDHFSQAIGTTSLLSGAKNSHFATLMEGTSRFVMRAPVKGEDSNTVVDALNRQVGRLPKTVMASLTWDRANELAFHNSSELRQKSLSTSVTLRASSRDHALHDSAEQRVRNDNTNGLL
jgi:IS30 family transposase